MEIRNKNFFSEISKFMTEQGNKVVLAVIDEQPTKIETVVRTKDVPEPSTMADLTQRWNIVTTIQLKLLAWAAAMTTCKICEITFGGASTEQISCIMGSLPDERRAYFNKKEANALKDENIREFVKTSAEHWVVMGYHTNACIAATCGVTPLSTGENAGLLQCGKKVYTAESVLHPEAPSPFWWADGLKDSNRALQFYYDLTVPSAPPPPPPDDC